MFKKSTYLFLIAGKTGYHLTHEADSYSQHKLKYNGEGKFKWENYLWKYRQKLALAMGPN